MFGNKKVKTVDEILSPLSKAIKDLEEMAAKRDEAINRNEGEIERLKEENTKHANEVTRANVVSSNIKSIMDIKTHTLSLSPDEEEGLGPDETID